MPLGDLCIVKLKATGEELWQCSLAVLPTKGDTIRFEGPNGAVTSYVIDNVQHIFKKDPAPAQYHPSPIVPGRVVIEVKIPA